MRKSSIPMSTCFIGLMLMLLIGICGCDDGDTLSTEDVFAIYLPEDMNTDYIKQGKYELSNLQLRDEPWLSIDDIDFYDFSTHYIYLKQRGKALPSWTSPFVVVANGERCYLGQFHSPFSSSLPMSPTIMVPLSSEPDIWFSLRM